MQISENNPSTTIQDDNVRLKGSVSIEINRKSYTTRIFLNCQASSTAPPSRPAPWPIAAPTRCAKARGNCASAPPHASDLTVNYIKDEPVKSILIAAATGAALMGLVSLMEGVPLVCERLRVWSRTGLQ